MIDARSRGGQGGVVSADQDRADRDAVLDVELTGGNWSAVVRRGGAVHRSAGSWTPTVHLLLEHVHARGITWLPRPLGTDEQGREVLTFLPGVVPAYPMPAWVWTNEVLTTAGGWLAQLHAASANFDTTNAVWQLPSHEPVEVICLNDVAPYNMVFDDARQLSGWIDVDTASPGPRVWDLAYLAYRLAPLTTAEDTGAGSSDLRRSSERLARLCTAYATTGDRVDIAPAAVVEAVPGRLRELADWTAAAAAAGAEHVATHVELYRQDALWCEQNARPLTLERPSQ